MDYMFGARLRAFRERAQLAQASERRFVVLEEGALEQPARPSRKRKRSGDGEAGEEAARPLKRRRGIAPDGPLSLPAAPGSAPPWAAEVHAVALAFEGRARTLWSHSNVRNPHPRSARSRFVGGFEAPTEHYYIVDGRRDGLTSVTTFLHHFFRDFDEMKHMIASRLVGARDPASPYFGMTSEREVLGFWDRNRDNGTCKHAAMDDVIQGRPLRQPYQVESSEAIWGPPAGFYRFMTDHPELESIFTEFTMFDLDHMLVGQCDWLAWDKERQCAILIDWKNVMKFQTWSRTMGTDPLTARRMDCHLVKYTLQLNIYRDILERLYGFAIAEMWIVNFPPLAQDVAHYDVYVAERVDLAPFFARCPITPEGRQRLAETGGE